jgi:multidrug transporter EmrE-like cation transporter
MLLPRVRVEEGQAMNWLAIIVAAVVNVALGWVWFGPLFGKKRIELTGSTDPSGGRSTTALYTFAFLAAIVTAAVLAFFLALSTAYTVVEGVLYGLYAGVGFVGTAMLGDALFTGRKLSLYLIVAGYPALALIVMGAILGAWH